MMGAFGRFLELSVPTTDILRSLGFYRALGFAELTTGDIRRHHYAVVTDGAIAIGLHAGGTGEIALCFVRPNLAKQVAALEAAGHIFELRKLGADDFHEAALRNPDGQLILMLEARTFSPGLPDEEVAPLIGRCTQIRLGCRDVGTARAFWEQAGFLAADSPEEGSVRLTAPGLTLGLYESARATAPELRFEGAREKSVFKALAAKGLHLSAATAGAVLKSPEGLQLVLQ